MSANRFEKHERLVVFHTGYTGGKFQILLPVNLSASSPILVWACRFAG